MVCRIVHCQHLFWQLGWLSIFISDVKFCVWKMWQKISSYCKCPHNKSELSTGRARCIVVFFMSVLLHCCRWHVISLCVEEIDFSNICRQVNVCKLQQLPLQFCFWNSGDNMQPCELQDADILQNRAFELDLFRLPYALKCSTGGHHALPVSA